MYRQNVMKASGGGDPPCRRIVALGRVHPPHRLQIQMLTNPWGIPMGYRTGHPIVYCTSFLRYLDLSWNILVGVLGIVTFFYV